MFFEIAANPCFWGVWSHKRPCGPKASNLCPQPSFCQTCGKHPCKRLNLCDPYHVFNGSAPEFSVV